MGRPGSVPLSALHSYTITPHRSPDEVTARGDFYIVDGWLRESLQRGHSGMEVCYLIHFIDGDDQRARFALTWSPLREQVVELLLRCGSLVGPCRLIRKPLYEGLDIWVIVGVEADGNLYDPLADLCEPECVELAVTF